jgi:DNA adenine methylase
MTIEAPILRVERPLLRYYGGKWRLAPWIISHFPKHICYVEPFGGAASVLLRKEPSQFEVYNDLDQEVVNFFRVLRTQPRELFRALKYTPFAREEFEASYFPAADPVERARQFFVMAWQGYGGPRREKRTGWKNQARAWHSGRADQMSEWKQAKQITQAVKRFENVQIENDDALKVIQRFDTPETLFYCDPPYPALTRNRRWAKTAYSEEIGGQDHLHLANLLQVVKGFAIISTYPNEMYDEVFSKWKKVTKTAQTMNKTIATEVLYISPRTAEALKS